MAEPFYRMSDGDFLAWAAAMSRHLTDAPPAFGISAAQAGAFADLLGGFDAALARWADPATRTPVASAAKRAARQFLLDGARHLVSTINSNPATTDAQRGELGIALRRRPARVQAPADAPIVVVEGTRGRSVTCRLVAPGSGRGRPAGARGAGIYSFVGPAAPTPPSPPNDPAAWHFEGLMTATRFTLDFARRTDADTVWVSAHWYNARGEPGPSAAPATVNLPANAPLPAEASMKLAA